MSATVVLLGLFAGTYVLKAAGPLLLGGRELPPALTRLAAVMPAALLAGLAVAAASATGTQLVVDARLAGVAAAAVALWLRLPFVWVVLLAAAVTAGVRALL